MKNEAQEPVKKVCFDKETVYCNKKSIRMSEFYQAQGTRYKPEITLEVRKEDISSFIKDSEDNLFILYEGKEYSMIRTYEPSEDIVEIVLQRGIANGST